MENKDFESLYVAALAAGVFDVILSFNEFNLASYEVHPLIFIWRFAWMFVVAVFCYEFGARNITDKIKSKIEKNPKMEKVFIAFPVVLSLVLSYFLYWLLLYSEGVK